MIDVKNLEFSQNQTRNIQGDRRPDDRSGDVYDYTDDLLMATKVALVTGRPLLLRGEPGSGKSSYAPFVARNLNWRYYESVVTARTEARDLMWKFDLVRRLADAHTAVADDENSGLKKPANYVEPGALWWVYDKDSAKRRGPDSEKVTPAVEPFHELNSARDSDGAILLIDEIDKGDPDVPNNLLVAIGSRQFVVDDIGFKVEKDGSDGAWQSPLIIITTNQERALPQAFLRRCIIHELAEPDEDRLIRIANAHSPATDERLVQNIAERTIELRNETAPNCRRPSVAEFLDALNAADRLGIDPEGREWESIEKMTLQKERA